jgi:hypothetical protein
MSIGMLYFIVMLIKQYCSDDVGSFFTVMLDIFLDAVLTCCVVWFMIGSHNQRARERLLRD